MTKITLFIMLVTFAMASQLRAQAPNNISIMGLQNPSFSSLTATTGGSLAAGAYFYIVVGVDTLGGQSGFFRGTQVLIAGANNAVSLSWAAAGYAKSYKIYRSTDAYNGSWYLLSTTTATTFTDLGAAGTLATPSVTGTAIPGIKSNSGIDIKDQMGWNVVKSSMMSGYYSNYPSVNIAGDFQFGTTGIYGGNGGLIKAYQGIQFEPADSVYGGDYYFRGKLGNYTKIILKPADQYISLVNPAGYEKTIFNQGVADGADAIAFKFVSANVLSNSAAKLLSVYNQNTECFAIMASGNVQAKKVTVTQTGWSDYVFDKSYRLPTLQSVEKFIGTNRHLPDVPNAKTVEEEGINLGDNQAILLKKIEELTLYVIKLNKANDRLRKDFNAFKRNASITQNKGK